MHETHDILDWLTPNPNLPKGLPQEVSTLCYQLARSVYSILDADHAELTVGLRKLLEAKDCFVRAAINNPPRPK